MKTVIIVILVLLVLGLYFYTDFTKEAMHITGNFIADKIAMLKN